MSTNVNDQHKAFVRGDFSAWSRDNDKKQDLRELERVLSELQTAGCVRIGLLRIVGSLLQAKAEDKRRSGMLVALNNKKPKLNAAFANLNKTADTIRNLNQSLAFKESKHSIGSDNSDSSFVFTIYSDLPDILESYISFLTDWCLPV